MAGYLDFSIDSGIDFQQTVTLYDVNNNTLNLANYQISSNIKKSYYTSNVAASFNVAITNAQSGIITLTLPRYITGNLYPRKYVYDMMALNQTSNTATKILEGMVIINPGVTILSS